jgi:hypothetical protein
MGRGQVAVLEAAQVSGWPPTFLGAASKRRREPLGAVLVHGCARRPMKLCQICNPGTNDPALVLDAGPLPASSSSLCWPSEPRETWLIQPTPVRGSPCQAVSIAVEMQDTRLGMRRQTDDG